jgi:5-methyltetrahydrofolate--homocysteine methyltransferase
MAPWGPCSRATTRRRPISAALDLENCNENLCITHPEWIFDIHKAYVEAGADIITTNSFQASPIVLEEFGLADKARELNLLAVSWLARRPATVLSPGPWGPPRNRFPCAAMSASNSCAPATKSRRAPWPKAESTILLIETGFDTRNVKAALLAVRDLNIPTIVSGTIERWGPCSPGQPWTRSICRWLTPSPSPWDSTARPVPT